MAYEILLFGPVDIGGVEGVDGHVTVIQMSTTQVQLTGRGYHDVNQRVVGTVSTPHDLPLYVESIVLNADDNTMTITLNRQLHRGVDPSYPDDPPSGPPWALVTILIGQFVPDS